MSKNNQAKLPELGNPATKAEKKAATKEAAAVVAAAAQSGKGKRDFFFQEVSFNHIPSDDRPFGVVIDFVDGNGEIHTVAGRGKSSTEAIIAGIKSSSVDIFGALNQPFEIVAAVKKTKETPAQIKIIRAIETGSFDKGADQGIKK
jgi:hypothetical protein